MSMSNYGNQILKFGFGISTKALDTYDICCDLFGFKREFRGKFAPQKKLYAENATVEGYNVWMLAHNSLIESFNTSNNWFNIIVNSETIKEVWFDATDATKDITPRICFFKLPSRRYVFQGVYILKKIEMEEIYSKYALVRTFERISTTYPINIDEKSTNTPLIIKSNLTPKPNHNQIEHTNEVVDGCIIDAFIIESKKRTTIFVDLKERPMQKMLIGKKKSDTFSFPNINLTYRIEEISISKS